jgi:two-component system, chemotaxis family, chemotaxis protein CheY
MLKVLIADDSAFMRTIIKNYIKEFSEIQIIEAEDGKDAISKFSATIPDVVFLDMIMPGLSGLEVLKEIKKVNKKSRIIMVTSVGQSKVIEEALKNGAERYITKPFKAEEIKKIIQQSL